MLADRQYRQHRIGSEDIGHAGRGLSLFGNRSRTSVPASGLLLLLSEFDPFVTSLAVIAIVLAPAFVGRPAGGAFGAGIAFGDRLSAILAFIHEFYAGLSGTPTGGGTSFCSDVSLARARRYRPPETGAYSQIGPLADNVRRFRPSENRHRSSSLPFGKI